MLDAFTDISWLAVGIATAVNAALGAAWFMGPFKEPYAASLGRDPNFYWPIASWKRLAGIRFMP